MMEKLGQAKTHLELKKMIAEVDKNNSGLPHSPPPPTPHANNLWKLDVFSSICGETQTL